MLVGRHWLHERCRFAVLDAWRDRPLQLAARTTMMRLVHSESILPASFIFRFDLIVIRAIMRLGS